MRDELAFELGAVEVLRQSLRADVRPRLAAREDIGGALVRRQSLLLFDECEDEGRERDAVLSAFLHRRRGDRERRVLDPLFSDRSGFARAEHGRELKEEEHLHPPRCVRHDAHDVRKLLPVDRRHGLDDGRRKYPGDSFDGIVLDEARTDCQVEDLSGTHEDALERGALPGPVEPFDRVDDERGRDLVELTRSDRSDKVALESPPLILIAHDAPALQAAPELESIAQSVPGRRLLADLLFLSPRKLTGLRKSQSGEVPEKVISDLSVFGDPEDEAFCPGGLDLHRQPATKGHGESFFPRLECRNLLFCEVFHGFP